MPPGCDELDEQIVQLISGCQRRLFLYLFGLLTSSDLAEEALQETNAVLWRKRAEFQPGSNFFAWACSVAYFEACKARQQRRRKLPSFSDLFLEEASIELRAAVENADSLQTTLHDCMDSLSVRERELVDRRYEHGATTKSVAVSVGRSVDAVYKSLNRIHQKLFDCITARMREDRKP